MGEVLQERSAELTTTRAMTLAQKIVAKEQQLAALKAMKRRLEAKARSRESAAVRKADNRRKILIGAMMQAATEHDAQAFAELQAKLDAYLTRDDDRAIFGLAPVLELGPLSRPAD